MIKLVKITLAAALLISIWGTAPTLTRAQPTIDGPNLLKNPGFMLSNVAKPIRSICPTP